MLQHKIQAPFLPGSRSHGEPGLLSVPTLTGATMWCWPLPSSFQVAPERHGHQPGPITALLLQHQTLHAFISLSSLPSQ